MITMEEWVTIRTLKEKVESIRHIAKMLKLSRNTVRKALRFNKLPLYKRATKSKSKLDLYREVIKEKLKDDLIGSRILNDIRKAGYSGSDRNFYYYYSRLKDEKIAQGLVCERFETGPGEQGQFDWSEYTLEIGGKQEKVYIFCLTLCYSRRRHYFLSFDGNQRSCFESLEDSFYHFAGAPKEILVDNARVLVLRADPKNFQWNRHFLEFCGYYRIKPRACRVGRARTKGKVEKPFYYLEQHFIKGNVFRDMNHLIEELKKFEEEIDLKVHSTTREKPIERFEKEKLYLTPLPESRYVGTKVEWRKVSWDCLISFGGSKYSVPWNYAGKNVWIKTSRGRYINVYNQQAELIAEWEINPLKGSTNINQKHYEGLRKRVPVTKSLVEKTFFELFPDEKSFYDAVIAQQKIDPIYHLRGVIELTLIYPKEEIIKAISLAKKYNTYTASFIRGILKGYEIKDVPTTIEGIVIPQINIKRDLMQYQLPLDGGNNDRT